MRLFAIFAIALATRANAQTSFTVQNVSEYLVAEAAAQDGDAIYMLSGSYQFDFMGQSLTSKALRIIAPTPGTVTVSTQFGTRVVPPGASQFTQLVGIRFVGVGELDGGGPALRVASGAGTVFAQDCEFIAGGGGGGSPLGVTASIGIVADGARLHLANCELSGASGGSLSPSSTIAPGSAIVAIDTVLTLNGCVLRSGNGVAGSAFPSFPADPGAAAVILQGGRLEASGTQFFAGRGGSGFHEAFPATICVDPAAGGDAISLIGPAITEVRLFGSSLVPGAGGANPGPCGGGFAPNGAEFSGLGYDPATTSMGILPLGLEAPAWAFGGSVIQVSAPSPVPAPGVLVVSGQAADLSLGLGGFNAYLAPTYAVFGMQLIGATPVLLPTLPAGVDVRSFLLQRLQVSALGELELSSPQALTIR